MPEIPKQLKWYTPLRLRQSHSELSVAWRVSINEMTGCLEIKRAPLVRHTAVLCGCILGAICAACLFHAYLSEPVDDPELVRNQMLTIVLALPFLIFVVVSLDAFCTILNSRYWKGRLRFRFNSQNGELFFPRENVTYQRGDYSKLVLGCVRGNEVQWMEQFFGVRWASKKGVTFRESTQIFMLVLEQGGEWKRYNLADDYNSASNTWQSNESGSKQFMHVADILEQHLVFERFVKSYSKDECYEQQQ